MMIKKLRNMFIQLATKMVDVQISHPWMFLGLAFIMTVVAAGTASDLRLNPNLESMLDQDSEELQNLNIVREKAGGTNQLVIAIKGATEERRLHFGRELQKRLLHIKGVRSADLELPLSFFQERALWLVDLEDLTELVEASEYSLIRYQQSQDESIFSTLAYRFSSTMKEGSGPSHNKGYLTSEDGQYLFLIVTSSISISDLTEGRRLMDNIKRTWASLDPGAFDIEVRTTGLMDLYQEQHTILKKDLRNSSIIALVLGILIVAGFTRRWNTPFLIGTALLPGICWTFALVRFVQTEINVITGFLIAVLIGLGIDHGVHLVIRLRQECRHAIALPEALVKACIETLPPAVTSTLTTSSVFFCFLLSQFPGFYEFGAIAGIGVMMTLLSTLLILPPLFILCERRHSKTPIRKKEPKSKLKLPLPLAVTMVILFLCGAGYGASQLEKIPFRNDFRTMRCESETTSFYDSVSRSLGGGFSPAVMVVSSIDDAFRATEIIRSSSVENQNGVIPVGRVLSPSDFVPQNSETRTRLIEKLKALLNDPNTKEYISRQQGPIADGFVQIQHMTEAQQWSFEDVPLEFRRKLMTSTNDEYLVFLWPADRIDSDERKKAWEVELKKLSHQFDSAGISHQIADEMLINGWVSELVLQDRAPILSLALIIVFLILIIDFRSFTKASLVMTSLFMGILVFLGIVAALNMEFNLFNMIVVPSVIGLGIDAAVHIFHRYQKEGPGSIIFVLRRTGVAVLVAVCTTTIGFGSSLVSHNPGVRSLGTMAIIGMCATFFSAIVFFPSLLTLREWIRSFYLRLRHYDSIDLASGLTSFCLRSKK